MRCLGIKIMRALAATIHAAAPECERRCRTQAQTLSGKDRKP
jgi:hypothetical protein